MTRFYIGDLHLGHEAILTFKREDGSPVRSFASIDEMHGTILRNWNERVTAKDTIYVLGDVCFKPKFLQLLNACHGRKILIQGNHDKEKASCYLGFFADIRAYDIKEGCIASHIPIHPESLSRWKLNIHGHLHTNSVGDPRYFNVSVEQINYTPISLEEVLQKTGLRL